MRIHVWRLACILDKLITPQDTGAQTSPRQLTRCCTNPTLAACLEQVLGCYDDEANETKLFRWELVSVVDQDVTLSLEEHGYILNIQSGLGRFDELNNCLVLFCFLVNSPFVISRKQRGVGCGWYKMTCHIRVLVSSNFRLAGTANRRPCLC